MGTETETAEKSWCQWGANSDTPFGSKAPRNGKPNGQSPPHNPPPSSITPQGQTGTNVDDTQGIDPSQQMECLIGIPSIAQHGTLAEGCGYAASSRWTTKAHGSYHP